MGTFSFDDLPAIESALTEFQFDGAWIDIYVRDTSTNDWQRMLEFIRFSMHKWQYSVSGEQKQLPSSVADIFNARNDVDIHLSIDVASVTLNTYFFSFQEIEFDLDPRQVKDAVVLSGLFGYLRQLSRYLEKEVVLTPESTSDLVIFRITPPNNFVEHRNRTDR